MKRLSLHLHPRQAKALSTQASEVLYGGAAGGGKSHLLRVALVAWAAAVPGLQGYLFRRHAEDLLKNHLDGPGGFMSLLQPWFACGAAKLHVGRACITLWNGSRIFLCHCQYERDVYKYQGTEIHVLAMDELTHFSAPVYRFLRGRVRLGGLRPAPHLAERLPRILCAANPGGVGHNWVKAAFVDPQPPDTIHQTSHDEGGMWRQYLPARMADNPTLLEIDPDYARRLEGLGHPSLVRAMRDGDWNIVAGGALDDVWNPAMQVIAPFTLPQSWRLDRSFDWGSSRPFSVGWWAQADDCPALVRWNEQEETCHFPPGTLFRVAEYYGWNGKPNEGSRALAADVAREIIRLEKEMFGGRVVHPGPADPSIFDTVNGASIADPMERAGVRWNKAHKTPGSRRAGLEVLRARLTRATEFRETGQANRDGGPGLFVFDTCRHFIRTVPGLPRDVRRPDDVDSAAEDHVYDETRYRLLDADRTGFAFSLFG